MLLSDILLFFSLLAILFANLVVNSETFNSRTYGYYMVMCDSEYKLQIIAMKFNGTKWENYETRGFTFYTSLEGGFINWKGNLYFTTNN